MKTANKYGDFEFEVISHYQDVTKMHSSAFNPDCFFGIDDAEQIALITGNKDIQLGFASWDRSKAFLLHHQSANQAALCKIVSLNFHKDINATKELSYEICKNEG